VAPTPSEHAPDPARATPGPGPRTPADGSALGRVVPAAGAGAVDGAAPSPAAGLRAARAELLAREDLTGGALRAALVALHDCWLAGLLPDREGFALVAVGGLGRREPAPHSDLDLVLLHRSTGRDVAAVADAVWYPVWDAGVGLDHSVRTVREALAVARDDLRAALGLLDARHVAGDPALSAELREAAYAAWRSGAGRRVPELREATRERWEAAGELAFLLEPDLKEARGGLRDVHALRALAAAQLVDLPGAAVATARDVLLDARGELQRRAARPLDRLVQQEQAGVAAALGHAGADYLLRAVSGAGRAVAFAADSAWRRVDAELATRRRSWRPRRPGGGERRPLADGLVEQDGEVVLARSADPAADPVLVFRAAGAAARAGLPLAPHTLDRLAARSAPPPVPWPAAARDAFVGLLGAGPAAVPVLEALDQAGLLVRLLPEWERVRSRPQHNPVHRFTVDRHLTETAAEAAALARSVARPDLLLLGALLHDLGKGWPGDHTDAGVAVVGELAPRLGLPPADAATLVAMVRHHLLLPDTATRRDLDDPVTIRTVVAAVDGSADLLDLLHALAVADGRATGPAAWTDWKAGLVADLVARARAAMIGALPPEPDPLTPAQRELAAGDGVAVRVDGDRVTVAAPDTPGLLSRTAGVLALHQLDVRAATVASVGRTAVDVFTVAPRFGRGPDPALLRADVTRALAGSLPLADRLAASERAYGQGRGAQAPPRVLWFDGAATGASVLELRAGDATGLLHRVTAALERCGLDVRSARVSTLGGAVVDAFYVVGPDGGPVTDPGLRREVAEAVLAAAATPPPPGRSG
jgi:[protein-PII] uridylyltransferase